MVVLSAMSVGEAQGKTEPAVEEKAGDETATNSAVQMKRVVQTNSEPDYYLAYPGILPDQPLYVVKMIRDRIKLWTVKGTDNKVELLLLYADKRVGAALVLAEGGKDSLAVSTAQKGEKYLQSAVAEANKSGGDKWGQVLGQAARKHKQILDGVYGAVEGDYKNGAQQALDTNKLIIDDLRGKGVKIESDASQQTKEELLLDQEPREQNQEKTEKEKVKVGM